MKRLPYTTKSGLRIGSAYEPPAQKMSPEAEALQLALLERRKRQQDSRADAIVVAGALIAAAVLAGLMLAVRWCEL